MSQPPSHGSYSNSTGSNHLGSYDVISGQYHQGYGQPMSQAQSYAQSERSIPPTESTNLYNYPNLPPETKLPPSYHAGNQGGEFRPQPLPRTNIAGANNSFEQLSGQIPTSEIIKQLDFAANENVRLRQRLEDNNKVLEQKMEEIARCLEDKDTEKQEILKKYEDATNKFFEARVAVLGFKCRTMQLQGELDTQKKNGVVSGQPSLEISQYQQELDRLRKENQTLQGQLKAWGGGQGAPRVPGQPSPDIGQYQQELDRLRKENQTLQGQLKAWGGGQGAPRSLQQQLERLKLEKNGIYTEKTNLEGVIKELLTDVRSLQDKRALDQDEIKHISQRKEALDSEVAQLKQANFAVREQALQQQSLMQRELDTCRLQNQSLQVKPNSRELEEARSSQMQMMGEIYQLQEAIEQHKKVKSDMEHKVTTLQHEKELLGKKVEDMSIKLEEMERKQKYAGGVTPPVPKPRTNVQSSIEQLQREVRELRSLKEKAEIDLQNEIQHRGMSEQLLQEANKKSEEQKVKILRLSELQTGATNLEQEKQGLQSQIQHLQQQLAEFSILQQTNQRMGQQISELKDRCGSLEKMSQDEKEAKRRLQEDLMASQREAEHLKREIRSLKVSSSTAAVGEEPVTGVKKFKTPEVRLNAAMMEIRVLKNGIAEKDKQLEEMDEEKRRLKQQLQEKEGIHREWIEEKEKAARKTIDDLQQEKNSINDELDKIVREKLEIQNKLDECRQELTQSQDQSWTLDSQLATMKENLRRIQQQANAIEQVKNQTEHHLQTKHQEVEELTGRVEEQGIELQSIRTQIRQKETQRLVLENEQKDAQHALGEYKNECEALMGDYQSCAERLREAEEERDRNKKQVEIGLRELTKRADKIKQLDQQRMEALERQQHLDFQLKTYMDDFNRERQSREELADAIKHVERKNSDLLRENQELKSNLNRAAMRALQDDDEDTPPLDQPLPGRRSPYVPPPSTSATGIPLGATGHQQLVSGGRPFETPGMGGMVPHPRPLSREHEYKRSGEQQPTRAQILHSQPMGAQFGGHHPGDRSFRPPLDTGFPRPNFGDRPPSGQVIPPRPTGIPEHTYIPPTSVQDQFSMFQPLAGRLVGNTRPLHALPNDLNIGPLAPIRQPAPGHPPAPIRQPAPIRPPAPVHQPAPVREPPHDAERWAAPGEVVNTAPPNMPCPMCNRNDFKTITDLEIHSAQCTG